MEAEWATVVNKRHRTLKKKLEDIVRCEERLAKGETLVKEQKEKILSKELVKIQLAEVTKILELGPKEPAKKQSQDPVPAPEPVEPVIDEAALNAAAAAAVEQAVGSLLNLFHAARFISLSVPGGKENRQALIEEAKDSVTAEDFDALRFLVARIDGSANPFSTPAAVNRALSEGLQHAHQFLLPSSHVVTQAVTYERIAQVVDMIFHSDVFKNQLDNTSFSEQPKNLDDLLAAPVPEIDAEAEAEAEYNKQLDEEAEKAAEKVLHDLEMRLTVEDEEAAVSAPIASVEEDVHVHSEPMYEPVDHDVPTAEEEPSQAAPVAEVEPEAEQEPEQSPVEKKKSKAPTKIIDEDGFEQVLQKRSARDKGKRGGARGGFRGGRGAGRGGNSGGDRPPKGDRPPRGDRPNGGDRPPRGERAPRGDRAGGDRPPRKYVPKDGGAGNE